MPRPQPPHPNLLLVEGDDDQHSVVHLLRHHVMWPDDCAPRRTVSCPFWIEQYKGVTNLDRDFLSAAWKESGRSALGVVIDADDAPGARFQSVRDNASRFLSGLPSEPVSGGLIHHAGDGRRFGVWVMPDNALRGMLETFLAHCVRADLQDLWAHADEVVDAALSLHRTRRPPGREKALIHTFLAWLDPPGNPFGTSIKATVFDAHRPLALEFAEWCIHLFGLDGVRRTRIPSPSAVRT